MPPDSHVQWRSFHPWDSCTAEIPGKKDRKIDPPSTQRTNHHRSRGFTRGAEQFREGGDEKLIDLSTVKELRALRLPGMARELESQLEDPQRYKALSFEDRLALLVDAESVSRRKNTIQRRIHESQAQ